MNRLLPVVLTGVVTVGVAFSSVGCASRTDRAAESSAASVDSFQRRLSGMPKVIDQAVNDLMAATSGQNPNRAGDFQSYRRSLANMRDAARQVAAQYEIAVADSGEFWRQWARDARNATAAERAELERQMAGRVATREEAMEYFSQARASFSALVDSMTAIETRLAASLSEQSVLDAKPLIEDAIVDSHDVRNYIDRLDETIESARESR